MGLNTEWSVIYALTPPKAPNSLQPFIGCRIVFSLRHSLSAWYFLRALAIPTLYFLNCLGHTLKMVYYFTSKAVDPPAYVYVGKDKFESA